MGSIANVSCRPCTQGYAHHLPTAPEGTLNRIRRRHRRVAVCFQSYRPPTHSRSPQARFQESSAYLSLRFLHSYTDHAAVRCTLLRASRCSRICRQRAARAGSYPPAWSAFMRIVGAQITPVIFILKCIVESGIIVENESQLLDPTGTAYAKLYVSSTHVAFPPCLTSFIRALVSTSVPKPMEKSSPRLLPVLPGQNLFPPTASQIGSSEKRQLPSKLSYTASAVITILSTSVRVISVLD